MGGPLDSTLIVVSRSVGVGLALQHWRGRERAIIRAHSPGKIDLWLRWGET